MINLWEKNKSAMISFGKDKKKSILMLLCVNIALSSVSYFFIPFIITDVVKQDYYFTPWYLVALIGTCLGIYGLIYSLFSFAEKRTRKEQFIILGKTAGIYMAARVVLAVLAGIAGSIFLQYASDIGDIKGIIDRSIQVLISPFNAFLLLYFVRLLYNLQWKVLRENIVRFTIIFYVMSIAAFILQYIGSESWALFIRALFSASMITTVIVIALYLLKQEKKF